ncbi:MAG: hypothetical protein ACE5DK_06880 [Paracoccaceae bacterium]
MYKTSLGSVTAEIEALLVDKLSAKGLNLQQKIKSARRRLPRRIRKQADYLIEVEARYRNPKRAHQYDPERVLKARKQCVDHLEKIDRNARRRYGRISFLTTVLVNLFLMCILVAVVIFMRG